MAKDFAPEARELAKYERVIEKGLRTFVEVGTALLAIRDGAMYKTAGYKTFAHYCEDRWNLPRSSAYQLMNAAKLSAIADKSGTAPTHESQVRPLAPLKDQPELVQRAWSMAVEDSGDVPQASHVASAVRKIQERHCPPEPVPVPEPLPVAEDDAEDAEAERQALIDGYRRAASYLAEYISDIADIGANADEEAWHVICERRFSENQCARAIATIRRLMGGVGQVVDI